MELIGRISDAGRQQLLDLAANYQWDVARYVADDNFLQQVHGRRAFIRIPAGGRIHLHTDRPPFHRKTHTVLTTNSGCVCRVNGVDFQLELGGIYEVDASLPHESWNTGDTDRIHLVETLEVRR